MEEQENTLPSKNTNEPGGNGENERSNYTTSLPSDGPISNTRSQGKSDLQNNENEQDDTDDVAGDLSGNAAGNTETDEE